MQKHDISWERMFQPGSGLVRGREFVSNKNTKIRERKLYKKCKNEFSQMEWQAYYVPKVGRYYTNNFYMNSDKLLTAA